MNPHSNDRITGALRRRIVISAGAWHVMAAVEDDYHHFVIALDHDGRRVTGIASEDLRTPWTTCVSAGGQLRRLVGMPLSTGILAAVAQIDAHAQCTHQFDLALMAIAQAVRGGRRQYDIEVTDAVDGARHARVIRDGQPCLDWLLQGTTITAPAALAGTNLRAIDMRALASSDPENAEAIGALRRGVMIAGGRGIDFSQIEDLRPFAGRMSGACYTFQPERIALGKRNKDSVRDFSRHPELLLKDFRK